MPAIAENRNRYASGWESDRFTCSRSLIAGWHPSIATSRFAATMPAPIYCVTTRSAIVGSSRCSKAAQGRLRAYSWQAGDRRRPLRGKREKGKGKGETKPRPATQIRARRAPPSAFSLQSSVSSINSIATRSGPSRNANLNLPGTSRGSCVTLTPCARRIDNASSRFGTEIPK